MLADNRVDTKTDHGDSMYDRDETDTYVLYVAFRADAPMTPPSRHALRGVRHVGFGRGPRAATRSRDGLELRVPDELMSTSHGSLVCTDGGWILDAPDARNAILFRGSRTRSTAVVPGQSWVLGNTVFLLTVEAMGRHEADDVDASALVQPLPELATFDRELANAFAKMAIVAKEPKRPVLLLGPTGTGKEVTARALHRLSGRQGEFVAVNCGGIDAQLFTSEMFGHQRGAFTGATQDTVGYVRSAHGGTLFLDEIGELSEDIQTKLLRVLQEHKVNPIGVTRPIPVDIRLCAATNRDLPAMMAAGKFREDLYSRMLGFNVALPPLRARRADLGLLIPALLRQLPNGHHATFRPAVAARIFDYDWPLNIRQLESALGLMTDFATGRPVGLDDMPDYLRAPVGPPPSPTAPVQSRARARQRPTAALTPQDEERKAQLLVHIDETRGNVAEIARRLGKDRTQIYRWIRRYELEDELAKFGAPVEDSDD